MQQALRADEHPYIDIRPVAMHLQRELPIVGDQWVTLVAAAQVTLAGTSQDMELFVKARRIADRRWEIRSQKALCMLDFGIEPPTALGGLIKVRDEITINFDLVVESK